MYEMDGIVYRYDPLQRFVTDHWNSGHSADIAACITLQHVIWTDITPNKLCGTLHPLRDAMHEETRPELYYSICYYILIPKMCARMREERSEEEEM